MQRDELEKVISHSELSEDRKNINILGSTLISLLELDEKIKMSRSCKYETGV